MMDIYKEILDSQADGKSFILVTVVKTSGSTPRDSTAKMIVYPDRSIKGTIGGGNLENNVIADCLSMFDSKMSSQLNTYSLFPNGENETGMCCGGMVDVFMELHSKPKSLIIFGAGHIGRELSKLAAGLNFMITVIDDREEILESYGTEIKTILTDENYSKNIPVIDIDSFVVLVTRSHQLDCKILKNITSKECTYIGMIGSRAKIKKVFKQLESDGVEQAALAKVKAPIGLDIKAEGPYEIAVSILAEVIAAKNAVL